MKILYMNRINLFICLVAGLLAGCNRDFSTTLFSPDEKVAVTFSTESGKPFYAVNLGGRPVILKSAMGFVFKSGEPLDRNLKVKDHKISVFDETWEQPWGEKRTVKNNYNQLTVYLEEAGNLKRKMNIFFRVYNDGIGFRYEIPEQENMDSIFIMDEVTEFVLADNQVAWWIPAYRYNRYEYLYSKSLINDLDTVHTPLTIETTDSLYLCIHEANLTDYASMTLAATGDNTLKCDLVPWADGIKVKSSAPMVSPWRTIQIAESPGDLITSYLGLNLNEPCVLKDISWIKPSKYVGIWWTMHLNKHTWRPGPNHGATTENMIKYIDFASENGFDGVLAEGWNLGWDVELYNNGSKMNFTASAPDFDLEKISAYAKEKHVSIIGHHETGAAVANYERQMTDAFELYKKYDIHCIKTGYVGSKLDNKEWHHGQFGVNHFQKVTETAAKYKIMIYVHEPIKPTGLCRTYPSMMAAEGARGQEYNAWSPDGGNPPEHETILPFTRLLAGPMDFTPGIFDIMLPDKPHNRINTTLAKQLALYVVIYSPLQMAADLLENYANNAALTFIKDVPVDWEETKVLNGEIGDYVTIVRKDRNSGNWFLGSVSDEESRDFQIDLNFLSPGQKYLSRIYADGEQANWETNPLDIRIEEKVVTSDSTLLLHLAKGGGQAISFKVMKN